MHLSGIDKNSLALFKGKDFSVDIVLHLTGADHKKFNVIMPVAYRCVIRIMGEGFGNKISRAVRIIIDDLFGQVIFQVYIDHNFKNLAGLL